MTVPHPTKGAETVRLPVWLVALLVAAVGSLVTIAYTSGGIVEGLRELRAVVEKIDMRMDRVERTQATQGADIAGLKARVEPLESAGR